MKNKRSKAERDFQAKLIKDIKKTFPESIVLKNNASYIQGIPDLLVLNKRNWAALEVKRSKNAHHQPNQDYYVQKMNQMSCAFFVYPENKQEVMNELQRTLEA